MYINAYADRLLAENRQLKSKIAVYESDDTLAQMVHACENRVRGAVSREKRNYDAWMKAAEANRELKEQNIRLRQEKEKYCKEAGRLRRQNEKLEKNAGHLQKAMEKLREENESLLEKIAEKDRQIEALKETVCRLKAEKDHDGTTNGIPTSRTPAGKEKVIPNTRERSGRKKGGQPGHVKKTMEAFPDDEINVHEDHTLDRCPECGGQLEETGAETVKDEADYEVRIIKKRHHFPQYRCRDCGKTVRAKVPGRLKEQNQYGPALQAMALALVDLGFVSVSRAREILAGILHRKLVPSEGYVGKVQKKASRMLKGFLEEARAFCLEQRILHWDDTVIFMNTSRACFRFYGNEKVAYYTAHATKGASGIMEDGILSGLTEKTYLMHDHVKFNYRKEFLFRNIECIQHMERELERVFRASGHTWARDMKGLIQETVHQRKQYLKAGKDSFTSVETDLFEEKLENLLVRAHREQKAEGSRYFSTDEKNAIRKLEEYRSNYFAWVYDFTLPATNNISESGLRMTKTKQKVSGQFLKEETASEFAAVRTYTETCRKNGINEYDALERLMAGEPYIMQEILTGVS